MDEKKLDPAKYRVQFGPDVEVTDIDLDEEEFYYQGERLTEERAEQLAQEILGRVRRKGLMVDRTSVHDAAIDPPAAGHE